MTDTAADLALQLIQTQRTLVLATADPQPWSAPVYYVYQPRRFYFFSSANSRHVTSALASERCAGAICRDSDDWREIEGLQMEGKLERISPGAEAIGALSDYLKKFQTAKEFFGDAACDVHQFTQRFRHQLYAFVPEHLFYVNNHAGLSKRREIQLPL